MKPLVTVLYEDLKIEEIGKEFPMHRLAMRMDEDDSNGQSWKPLRLVEGNPRNVINNVFREVSVVSLTACAGSLYVMVEAARVGMAAQRVSMCRRRPGLPARAGAEVVQIGATA